ncbi:MAG: UDP-N-acetylmuramoyl-tripeptide--D-alanyl-D-alanine ligase [Clostridiales Family XIII bacterium]|jgi:UDP-N-acetylmuramoyl-tripeptide--D-alanyl-D-alanine ligase|nr:UDP-N-acetylmuramoyl-tripeptide--D-alanyl-D-alanine ligase [Clostridiales Family XIII bacterium]
MIEITIRELVNATGGTLVRGREGQTLCGVSSDSRSLGAEDVFFALPGEKFDGHDFLAAAASSSCAAVVVSLPDRVPEAYAGAVVSVPDTVRAYQDLAAYVRERVNPFVVAVTGSVGKTSLKDMLGQAFGSRFRTVVTEKNFNNHLGLPLTIFRMDAQTEVLVAEMGMDIPGEILRLVEIARPDVGLISNIGLSHRENFSDDEGIFRAKMELVTYFGSENLLIVNGDDPKLAGVAFGSPQPYRILTAGTDARCDYVVEEACAHGDGTVSFTVTRGQEQADFRVEAAGLYNALYAAMTAAACGQKDIPLAAVAQAVQKVQRTAHRLEVIKHGSITIIDDSYNASPDSMRSGIEVLMALAGGRKFAVLAGMNELGPASAALHGQVGREAVLAGVDGLIAVGSGAAELYNGAVEEAAACGRVACTLTYCADNAAAVETILDEWQAGDVYLLKGSNSMRMWEIADGLMEADFS